MKILITGKNSYIAQNFEKFFNEVDDNYSVNLISVRDDKWKSTSFEDYDIIIHAAALVHDAGKHASAFEYDKINYKLTIELAQKAKNDGVKHFIFLSSMSVYGINTGHITASTPIKPKTLYGKSKAKAEEELLKINSSEFTVTILRPPMIYGPNSKGNFKSLVKISRIAPIFPQIDNRRSAIYIDNLCQFLQIIIDSRIEGIQFPQNSEYLNTTRTIQLLAKANSINIHISNLAGYAVNVLMFAPVFQKAFGNLTYDPSLPGGPDNLDYNIVSFEDSVNLSNQLDNDSNRLNICWQRPIDFTLAASGLIVAAPLLIGTTIIGYLDTGSPLFIQERVGKDKKPFKLVKFRTMNVDTASVASHLADTSSITKLGGILRKTKLDELPQLINVLKGEMSLVGPRPNLFNQHELIEARDDKGVYNVLPGITGLAQLSGIDMSTPELLAETDKEMIDNLTLKNYFSYIIRTALGKGSGDAIKVS